MLSAADIKEVKFGKAINGYNKDEVDVLLDKVETDYVQYERSIKDLQGKINVLNKEIEGYKSSQASLQNVLINAQKLADQIVADAKVQSEAIIAEAQTKIETITQKEKELSATFEVNAEERKAAFERELNNSVAASKIKTDSMIAAAEDSVTRQQALFDRLKLEVAAFKAEFNKTVEASLKTIHSLPDAVPMDPAQIAMAVSAAIDRMPEPEEFIEKMEPAADPEPEAETVTFRELGAEEEVREEETGFVVNDEVADEAETADEAENEA